MEFSPGAAFRPTASIAPWSRQENEARAKKRRKKDAHLKKPLPTPIKTGIKPIDRMGLMDVAWYSRQLRRIANGGDAKPNESGLISFLLGMSENGLKMLKTRLRA